MTEAARIAMILKEEATDPRKVEDAIWEDMQQHMKPIALPERLFKLSKPADQQKEAEAEEERKSNNGVKVIVGQSPMDAQADILLHCCNCLHTMGAGMAKSVKERLPAAFDSDRKTPFGELQKLGTYSSALCRDMLDHGHQVTVVNLYCQFDFGRGGNRRLNYKALRLGLSRLVEALKEQNCPKEARIATYWLGCNNAGGDKRVVKQILEEVFSKTIYTVLVYTGTAPSPSGGYTISNISPSKLSNSSPKDISDLVALPSSSNIQKKSPIHIQRPTKKPTTITQQPFPNQLHIRRPKNQSNSEPTTSETPQNQEINTTENNDSNSSTATLNVIANSVKPSDETRQQQKQQQHQNAIGEVDDEKKKTKRKVKLVIVRQSDLQKPQPESEPNLQ